MICPYCKNEMEQGYIEAGLRNPLVWASSRYVPPKGLLPVAQSETVKLASRMKSGRVTVHRCAPCGKFIINEEELEI